MSQPRFLLPLPESRSPWISLLLVCFGVFLGAWIGQLIAAIFLLRGVEVLEAVFPSKAWLLTLQATTASSAFILAPLGYLYVFEPQSLRRLFQWPQSYGYPLVLTLGLVFSFMVVDTWIVEWNKAIQFPSWLSAFEAWAQHKEAMIEALMALLTTFDSLTELGIGIGVIGVIPAVGEELLFRGVLQNLFHKLTHNIHGAIGLSALVFSAIHLQFYGFFPRFLLGALFGYIYWWTKDLVFPVLAHLFNNTFTLLLLFLYQRGSIEQDPTQASAPPWPVWTFFVLLAVVFAFLLRRQGQAAQPTQEV